MSNYFYFNRFQLKHNLEIVKEHNPNSKICAMVKANAYGTGLKDAVKTLNGQVDFFGVANEVEARAVRRYSNVKVLIVGALNRHKPSLDFSHTCMDLSDIRFLIGLNKPVNIHLKVNTGMNRFGFKTLKDFRKALKLISKSNLNLEGVFTHFATTDELVAKQFKLFTKYLKLTKKFNLNPIVHADNSFVNLKCNHHLDIVRVGFCLYNHTSREFSPVVEIASRVAEVNIIRRGELVGYDRRFVAKERMKVAVLPIGYADGFDMHLIGFKLNINGVECKVLNICMDCFMLDVSKIKIKKGDKIFILNKSNPLSSYAKHLSTSEYEIMCKFSFIRAKHIYLN